MTDNQTILESEWIRMLHNILFWYDSAAETVELYIGENLTPDTSQENMTSSAVDISQVHFIHLGNVTMSTNQSTGFKARELKSITVKCVGAFVKLLINKAYKNKYNRDQQVANLKRI